MVDKGMVGYGRIVRGCAEYDRLGRGWVGY